MSIVNRYKTKPGEKEQIDKQKDKHNLLNFFITKFYINISCKSFFFKVSS